MVYRVEIYDYRNSIAEGDIQSILKPENINCYDRRLMQMVQSMELIEFSLRFEGGLGQSQEGIQLMKEYN